jgi:signal transduction histidine kinase
VRGHGGRSEAQPTGRWASVSRALHPTAATTVAVGAVVFGSASVHVGLGWDTVALWLPDLAVGLTLVGAGLLAWGRSRAVATLLVAAGFAWFAGTLHPVATAWHRGPMTHLLLCYPRWRPRTRLDTVAIGVGYVAALVPSVWWYESVVVLAAAVLVGLLLLAVVRADRRDRRHRWVALGAGTAIAGVSIAGTVARARWPGGAAVLPALLAYELVLSLAVVGLVVALLRTATSEVTDLVVELDGARSGSLRAALADVLHDPQLAIGYWSAGEQAYLDARGSRVTEPAGPERVATHVPRGGAPLALLVHDRAVLVDPALAEAVAVATRLTADNAALQAEVRDRLAELTASRRRLVVAADEQRRDLARRLTAGPVRRLEVLRDTLAADTAGSGSPHVSRAREHIDDSLAALDHLARGLHPLELEHGLAVALAGLAERSPVRIELTTPNARFPVELEVAAWFTCVEAVANAMKHAQPSLLTISVRRRPGQLVIVVADDGCGGADPEGVGLRGLADRLEALGGRLTVDSVAGRGTAVTAQLPLPERRG